MIIMHGVDEMVLRACKCRQYSDIRSLRNAHEMMERVVGRYDQMYNQLPAHHRPFYDEVFGAEMAAVRRACDWLSRSIELLRDAQDSDQVWAEWIQHRLERRNRRRQRRAIRGRA